MFSICFLFYRCGKVSAKEVYYICCRLTYECEVLSTFSGISKPLCKYFCPHCYISSADLDAINDLKEESKQYSHDIKDLNSEKSSLEDRIKEVNEAIEAQTGPLTQRFNTVLDEIKLKAQVYHSGTLVGMTNRKSYSQRTLRNFQASLFF